MATSQTVTKAKPKSGARATRKSTRAQTRPADAIKLLKDDHREVKAWFQEFDKTEDDARKQELAYLICKALTVHAQIEEEVFYSAAYEALEDDDLLDEAEIEHATAKGIIADIMSSKVGEPLFDARITVLGEYVDHDVEEDESELFPKCRASDMDLKALGVQLGARKAELMSKLG